MTKNLGSGTEPLGSAFDLEKCWHFCTLGVLHTISAGMKTGYLFRPGKKNRIITNRFTNYLFLTIGWVLAANFFVILKSWGIEDTTGYLVFAETKGLAAVHIEASIMGLFLGMMLSYLDRFKIRLFGRKKAFGVTIVIIGLSHLIAIIVIVTFVAFIFLLMLGAGIDETLSRITTFCTSTYFLTIVIYGAVVSFLFSFIQQVDSKFGPGNLLNLLTGKYHRPMIEDRIFLFIDLKNATGTAEKLGHIRFSQLLQDCFYDITPMIKKYQGEIYQYIGDEIVVTWRSRIGLKKQNCINLFFSFINKIQQRSQYYTAKYGLVPEFKAGMNCGRITVAEVGVIKREIAYHGDTINTASIIQTQCNKYNKLMLISGQLLRRLGKLSDYKFEFVDHVALKGKKIPVDLFSVA